MRYGFCCIALLAAWTLAAPAAAGDFPTTAPQEYPPPSSETVRLSPAPDVTFLVPKGWFACDDAANKLLGDVTVSPDFRARVCPPDSSPIPPYRLAYPDPNLRMLIWSQFARDSTMRANYFAAMPARELQQDVSVLCTQVSKSQSIPATQCNLDVETFAGRSCLVGRIVGTTAVGGVKVFIHFLAIPSDGGVFMIGLVDTEVGHATSGPIVEAIANSISMPSANTVIARQPSPITAPPADPGKPLLNPGPSAGLPRVTAMVAAPTTSPPVPRGNMPVASAKSGAPAPRILGPSAETILTREMAAELLKCSNPPAPGSEEYKRVTGTTTLRTHFLHGAVAGVEVKTSSGDSDLDQRASQCASSMPRALAERTSGETYLYVTIPWAYDPAAVKTQSVLVQGQTPH